MVTTPSMFDNPDDELRAARDEDTSPRAAALRRPEHPELGAFTGHTSTSSTNGALFDALLDQYVSSDGTLM